MPITEKTRQIVSAFNTKNEDEISNYTIEDLREAVVDLGWRNEGDKRAIQYRIDELDKTNDRQYQSYTRAISYIATLAIGVLAGYIVAKL